MNPLSAWLIPLVLLSASAMSPAALGLGALGAGPAPSYECHAGVEGGAECAPVEGDDSRVIVDGNTPFGSPFDALGILHVDDGLDLDPLVNPQGSYCGRPASAYASVVDRSSSPTGVLVEGSSGATSGPDLILGSAHADTIYALDGDDCVLGGGGNDAIHGAAGNDILFGEAGNDLIVGDGYASKSSQVDCLNGILVPGRNVIDGGAGDDVLVGCEGNDLVFGQDGVDTVYGFGGVDTLRGGPGPDILYAGHPYELGGAMPGAPRSVMWGDDGDDEMHGSDHDELMVGGRGDDVLLGNGGNDRLLGHLGDDYLIGGPGHDFGHSGRCDDVEVCIK